MKAIPLTYAKDMQEDKEPLFDTVDTVQISLDVFAGAWQTMTIKSDRMHEALDGMILATDLADYLVGKGVPFRTSHRIVGELVRSALNRGVRLEALDLETLRHASQAFGEDIYAVLSAEASTNRRNVYGGTGRQSVVAQIENAQSAMGRRKRRKGA